MNYSEKAQENLTNHIAQNSYPGRGIIIGKTGEGMWIQIYWIMGRSENSRNRIFFCQDDVLQTQAADPSKVKDPSLIIYNPMRESENHYWVSNGAQTDSLFEGYQQGLSFETILQKWNHEPDAPNFTPRISGLLNLKGDTQPILLSIIKASPISSNESEYHFFNYATVENGLGYGITTYQNDGNPIPSFEGTPLLLPIQNDVKQIINTYWNSLNEDNKISLAIKTIDPDTKESSVVVFNKYQQVM